MAPPSLQPSGTSGLLPVLGLHQIPADRQRPYTSMHRKDGSLQFRTESNFNGRVDVLAENKPPGQGTLIVCRNLAYAYLTGGRGVLDKTLQSAQTIKEYFDTQAQSQVDVTAITLEALARSNKRQLVGNAQFGIFF